MTIPRWLVFLVAAWVIVFGGFRLYIASRKDEERPERPNFRRRGLYARSKRAHLIFGLAYLVLGAVLIAMGFGWQLDLTGSCLPKPPGQTSDTVLVE